MFKRILSDRITRFVSLVLIFTLAFPLYGAPLFPQPAHAQEADDSLLTSVAVIGFENSTNHDMLGDDYGIGMIISEAVKLGIEEREKLQFSPKDQVLKLLDDDTLINDTTALAIGEELGVEQVIFGKIENAAVKGTEYASVVIDLYIYDVVNETLISRSRVMGEKALRGFAGTPEQLIQKALAEAIKKALDEAISNQYKYGIVTMVSGDMIQTNLSDRDGLAKGATLAILSNAQQIATLEIREVGVGYSRGQIVDVLEREAVRGGLKVRLIYTPRAIAAEISTVDMEKRKKKFGNTALLVIGAIALAASLGGSKKGAEPPNAATGPEVKASRDGAAAVYSSTPFNVDYIPNPPTKITNISTSALAACNTATNCSQDVCPITGTAYDFTLATSPSNPNFPTPYVIGFDMSSTTLSAQDQSNLNIATCNQTTGEWVLYDASYSRCSWLGNKYCAYAAVAHFTPYVVVIDNRPDPLPAPANYSLGCDDSLAILSWSKIQDANNTGYKVYNCDETQCASVKQTIADPNTLSVEYAVSNGTTACYAISGISSSPIQDATKTSIKCTTPDPDKCTISGITLITPANNAQTITPIFRWMGTGESSFYVLTVKDKNDQVIMSEQEDGEAASSSSEGTRQQYSVDGDTTNFTQDEKYTWSVVGYSSTGKTTSSQQWVFTYTGGSTGKCPETMATPTLITPTDGSQITSATPKFLWSTVENATNYIISVLDDGGKLLYEDVLTTNTGAFPSGSATTPKLIDDKQYSWHVRAVNACGTASNESQPSFFTKKPYSESPLPAPQWVNQASDNKDPIIGGDQYVILQWRQITESNLGGYYVFRKDSATPPPDPESQSDLVGTILVDQLNAPPSNPNCPTFSTAAPGFCDVSVTNGKRYYYWLAAFDNGQSPSKISVSQSVLLDLQRPSLVAPGSVTGTTVNASAPSMIWLPVDGAESYIITVTDTSTNSIVMQATVSGTSTAYAGQALKDAGVYTWNVTALNPYVTSQPSQTFKFTKGQGQPLPDAPEWCKGLAVNCNGNPGGPPYEYNTQLANDTIKVYWKRVTTASNIVGYYLYRSYKDTDGTIKNDSEIFVSDYDCERAGQACYAESQMKRGMIYTFKLTTLDSSSSESLASESLEVRYDLRAPVVLYPASDQIVYETNPEFQWMHVNGATQYKIQIDRTGNFSSDLIWNAVLSAPSAISGVVKVVFADPELSSPKQPLENPANPGDPGGTTYYWRVCPVNEITTSDTACSNGFRFFKNLKPPTQISPIRNQVISSESVTFIWTTSPGAVDYEFRLCEGSSHCDSSTTIYQALLGDTTTYTLPKSLVQLESCVPDDNGVCSGVTGYYTWHVRAVDAAGNVSGRWENLPKESFVKVGLPAPNLIAPADGTILQPDENAPLCRDVYGNYTYNYKINFNWEDIANADGYLIRVIDLKASQDAGRLFVVYDGEVSQGELSIGTCENDGELPLASGREYEWNVTAKNSSYFDKNNAKRFITGLPAPNPKAPEDGKQVILTQDCDGASSVMCVHFEWNGGTFTNSTGATVSLPGVIGAASYDIEILNQQQVVYHCDRAYEVPTVPPAQSYKNLVNAFCDLSTADVFNNDTFTWRVRARDSSSQLGYPSVWSQNRQFTVLIPGPVLASPPPQGESCYEDHSIAGVESACTTMPCQNPRFWWSPIPYSPDACYRIEISDTADFRNPLRVANSVDNATDFVCEAGVGCNSYKTAISSPIPMTNGVVYYWRVGASVPPDTGSPCGSSWIYSETRGVLKRPNNGLGLTVGTVGIYDAALSWHAPVNCQNEAGDAVSTPAVPPNGGNFVTYLYSSGIDPAQPPYAFVSSTQNDITATGLSAGLPYIFCVAVVDDSFYFTDGGHVSDSECVSFTTLPEPTTP